MFRHLYKGMCSWLLVHQIPHLSPVIFLCMSKYSDNGWTWFLLLFPKHALSGSHLFWVRRGVMANSLRWCLGGDLGYFHFTLACNV